IVRQAIHTSALTVGRFHLRQGAAVPLHSHENEQVSMLESESLRFVLDGQETIAEPGAVVTIPPHVPHQVEALTDCVVVDVFSPPRLDWIRGDDAYLRKS
ncbi:MAG: cupin domain-containing protein, partial [Bryobacteraceae bacterium]|nr:cupin domain-containing protein [Bryobacteraceae bacterium]